MLSCEGYKMFKGEMKITPKTSYVNEFTLSGVFLYKPDTNCWYHKGSSYTANICTVIKDESV